MEKNRVEPGWVIGAEWLVLIAIMTLATYLRYWRLGEVPPGFNSDEAVGAVGALTTLREGLSYSYEGQGGGGALGFYFAAAAFYLFGPSIVTIRGLAAWASLVGLFAHYWAVREIFRGAEPTPLKLNQARLIAALSTLGIALSVWHLQASRVAFAGIGVPFLMLPSIYFLWRGLNRHPRSTAKWPFILSGLFLGGLMYIYLSGVFAPPLYAAFFIGQWLVVLFWKRMGEAPSRSWLSGHLEPPRAYLTSQFWNILTTALTAIILLLPIVYVVLNSPADEPGLERAGQASFLNPNINQGDPWGLLGRSIVGNFSAYGISPSWLLGQTPARLVLPPAIGLLVFIGFLIALWRGLRGRAAYLFSLLWFVIMLLPSILSPDAIPHTLRAIGATNPTYIFMAIAIFGIFELLWTVARRWGHLRLDQPKLKWPARAAGVLLAVGLLAFLWWANATQLYQYFYLFPQTNDAKAAYHVYAVEMAEEINREPSAETAFILPRNTAAGDINQNFTTDFLVDLAEPPAAHYWVVDDETTLPADLTAAAAAHNVIRVVTWKTSKHTGADPKEVIPYYLEKYGRYDHTDSFEYFDIDTYQLETPAPDFDAAETLQPLAVDFGGQLQLTGFALGNAGDVAQVSEPQANSNDLLWLRLAWQKVGDQPEDLKVSALLYADNGQLVNQVDKLLLNNILQVGSAAWEPGTAAETYILLPIPPATPPGRYSLELAVYGAESLARLPITTAAGDRLPLSPVIILPTRQPVDPAELALALPVGQEPLPGLTLVGFETLPGESVSAGSEVWASLLWQAAAPLADDVTMSLLVEPVEGQEATPISEPVGLAGSGYPTSQWQPGEMLRGWLKARISPTLEPGLYVLKLRLAAATDDELVTLPIGEFQIEGWPRNFEPPAPQVKMGAVFNEQARLVGLDAGAAQVAPGDTLTARLYWQAEAEFEQSYTAFVQVIGPDGRLYGQMDHIPGGGAFPTTGWLSGEYLTDEYAIPIATDAPPGDYQLAIGLYDPTTGQRLPLSRSTCQTVSCNEGDDAVRLPGLKVQ